MSVFIVLLVMVAGGLTKKSADIIIVADSSILNLRRMTDIGIQTCIRSEPNLNLNIYVIDGNKETRGFRNAQTIIYEGDFNYNRCLNIGLQYCSSDYIAFCNNDLLYNWHWLTNIIYWFDRGYHSASPNPKTMGEKAIREGYRIQKEVLGWCIVCTSKLIKKIGKLDEVCKFWYSDNVYAEQIKRAGFKHILVNDSYVKHLGSKTLLKTGNSKTLTKGQAQLFYDYKKKNHVNKSSKKQSKSVNSDG